MRRIDRHRAELDIITMPHRRCRVVAVAVSALFAAAASAQVGTGVEEMIEADVETAVEQQVEEELATAVEDQVEAEVATSVEDQVEAEVAASVEEQVEAEVAASVEEQVEAEVAASVEAQVEADVAASVEDQVEADVASSVEQQVEAEVQASVEDQIEVAVEEQLESGVAASIEAEVEASVAEGIELAVEGSVAETVETAVGADAADELEVGAEASLETGIGTPASPAGAGGEDGDEGSSAVFAGDLDAAGRTIERDVWIVLVPVEYSDRIDNWGFDVRERTELDGMDRVLLRIAAPGDRDIAQAALDLALDAPGTVVDFNHVYGATQDGSVIAAPAAAPAAAVPGRVPYGQQEFGSPAAIGLIDSEIESAHPALAGVEIEQRDFVSFSNERPSAHGTAVASLMLAAAGESHTHPGITRLRAASVFFRGDDGGIRATTAGLIAALDWLMEAPGVDVINMSLAGPPNRLLEIAIGDAAASGHIVVAAVGNNGPTGEPLYPAAYEAVVGVTAVDAAHRIYRYAGRGRHVMFAARGVDVDVAATAGGHGRLSGTSMAAPRVAVALAEAVARGHSPAAALEALKAAAVDLGEPDFDEIYGFGLVAAWPAEHPAQHTGLRSPR